MSNIKITQLPELAPTPLSGSDVFPVVSGNVTYQVTANAIATFLVVVGLTLATLHLATLLFKVLVTSTVVADCI
jgi:hypothetical protein